MEDTGEINLKETRLAVIPEDYDISTNVTFSDDGGQVFYKARKGKSEFIVVSSANSENKGPAYDYVTWLIRSPDGRRFAFGGKRGEKKYLVVDNKELKDFYYKEVAPGAFSPDGRLVASEVGGEEEEVWFIVVHDGEKEVYRSQAFHNTYRAPLFSPDGRVLVYELIKKEKKNVIFFLDLSARKIIREVPLCAGCRAGDFYFSSDSSRVIYGIEKEGKSVLVFYDVAQNREREIELPHAWSVFTFSPDGKEIVYSTRTKGKLILLVGSWESPLEGKEIGAYEEVGYSTFSPDATRFVYHAKREGKWQSVVGDKTGPAKYDGLGPLVFSPDGSKIAYPARKGGRETRRGVIGAKWAMVVSPSGKPGAVMEGPIYEIVVTPVFSPDSKYLAYRAREGTMDDARRFIVIASTETGKVIKEGPVNDEVWPPVWSEDSKAVTYGTRSGRELWWRVEPVE